MRSSTTPSYSQLLYNSYSSDPTLCDSLSHSLLLFYSLNIFPALSNRPRSSRLSFTATPTFFSFNDRRRLIAFFLRFHFIRLTSVADIFCELLYTQQSRWVATFSLPSSLFTAGSWRQQQNDKKIFFFAQSNNGVNKKSYFCARVNEIIE